MCLVACVWLHVHQLCASIILVESEQREQEGHALAWSELAVKLGAGLESVLNTRPPARSFATTHSTGNVHAGTGRVRVQQAFHAQCTTTARDAHHGSAIAAEASHANHLRNFPPAPKGRQAANAHASAAQAAAATASRVSE